MATKYLEEQLALQREVYGIDPASLEGDELAAYATFNAFAVGREVGEAMAHFKGWKFHSHAEPHVAERDGYVEELCADALRHLINLMLIAGVTDDELDAIFNEKRATIAAREESKTYER